MWSSLLIIVIIIIFLLLFGTVFAITSVCVPSEFRWTLSHASSNKNWINYRSQDTLRALVPVCVKKTRPSRTAIKAHNNLYFGDSDSVCRYFAITRWNVWDGLMVMVRVGIIIFHLFFILILLKRAERSHRGKLVRSMFLSCLGMFLRGVLEVGHGGPEERANKQVAEGGTRWDANSVLRQATHNSNENPVFKPRRGALSNSIQIKKHLPKHRKSTKNSPLQALLLMLHSLLRAEK